MITQASPATTVIETASAKAEEQAEQQNKADKPDEQDEQKGSAA